MFFSPQLMDFDPCFIIADFSENAVLNKNEFDVQAGRRCGFGRGDRGGLPRLSMQNGKVRLIAHVLSLQPNCPKL